MRETLRPFVLGLVAGGLPVTGIVIHRVVGQRAEVAAVTPAAQPPSVEPPSWLKREPGAIYQPASEDVLYRKAQTFDETWSVTVVDEASELNRRVGLRAGDRIISIDGRPVGVSDASRRFKEANGPMRVVIERDGERHELTFRVSRAGGR